MSKKNVFLKNAIEMKNISMIFGKFKANDNIDLIVKQNEIHAIIGENGAGKSTLMSILFGLYQPTSGSITIKGQKVAIKSPLHATNLKIGMVHQHFKLVDSFTIFDNIILNDEQTNFGFIRKKEARIKLNAIMEKYHFHVNLDKKVSQATVAEQQRTEILKILYRDSDILIFDEPSAILTPQQIDEFLKALLNLKKLGKTILIISHKLDELKRVADRGTIIRKGKVVGVVEIKNTSSDKIAELMVGRSLQKVHNLHQTVTKVQDNPLLIIKNLSVKKYNGKTLALKNISLNVKGGEIVAIAGIEGNGQLELINAISGLQPTENGQIYFNKASVKTIQKTEEEIAALSYKIEALKNQSESKNEDLEQLEMALKQYKTVAHQSSNKNMAHTSIKARYIHGLAHVPQDRHKYGLVLDMAIWENMVIQDYWKKSFSKWGFLKFNAIKYQTQTVIDKFDVRSAYGVDSITRYMSGGNQQKLVVGRELSKQDAHILIIAQPTRGLDVGAIDKIHQYILEARNQGKAILLVSYELDEIIDLADRVVVLNNGLKVDELPIKKVTKQKLGLLMTKQITKKITKQITKQMTKQGAKQATKQVNGTTANQTHLKKSSIVKQDNVLSTPNWKTISDASPPQEFNRPTSNPAIIPVSNHIKIKNQEGV